MTNPDRPMLDRRRFFRAAAPATVAVASGATLAAGNRTFQGTRTVDVTAFGAKGDGVADDQKAFAAALAVGQIVDVPPGAYRIGEPIKLKSGQFLRGCGRSGWEPYSGQGRPASPPRTEIIVENGIAIDARQSNNAKLSGISIRAKNARQSNWGAEPGFQPGTVGIEITGAANFVATDFSLHGLDIGIRCESDVAPSSQMPEFDNWLAHDCRAVFRIWSNHEDFYAGRDIRISGCIGAVHCSRIVEARKCDGLRIENVRVFQCKDSSILIERSPFITITGSTFFETGAETIVLRDCEYVSIAGTQIVRTGYFCAGRLVQKSGLILERCTDVTFEGLIQQSVGRAVTIRSCVNVAFTGAIGTPFWSTGAPTTAEGAIHIERSRTILINASFSGTTYWFAVWSDRESAATVAGRIAIDGPAGVARCAGLQSEPLGLTLKVSENQVIVPGRSVQLPAVRALVPAGKSLITCFVETTIAGLSLSDGERTWTLEAEIGGAGSLISLERRTLHRNATVEPRYATVRLSFKNLGAEPVAVDEGSELRLSLAFE